MDPTILGLDPLMWTHVKLFVKDVLELVPLPGFNDIYCFEDHNIRNVELCGIIVAVEQTLNMMVYILDDGTGTLTCTLWKDTIDTEETISLGSLVRILGLVNTFKDERKVKVFDVDLITDPNWELVHTLQVMALRRNHYKKVFDISSKVKDNIDTLKQEMQTRKTVTSITSHSPHLTRWQAYQHSLLDYARKNYGTTTSFTRQDLEADDDIYDLTQQYIRQAKDQEPTKSAVENLISETMTSLKKEGYIICTNNRGDYFKMFDDHDLEQEIMDVIRRTIENHTAGKLGGVNHQYISVMVQQKYKRQTKSMINTCIYNMVERSLIYKTDPGAGKDTGAYMILDD